MKTKTVVGAAVVLVLISYAGATWYFGSKAQNGYEEALVKAQKFLGPKALVSHEYQRGFWTSNAKAVVRWKPSAQADDSNTLASLPMQMTVDSTLRHGPLVGARLAAAVVQSRISVDGQDAVAQQVLAKVNPPTVTTVHHLAGGHAIDAVLPAGELGDAAHGMRWQALQYHMHVDSAGRHLTGRFEWPAVSLSSVKPPEEDDEDTGEEPAPEAQAQAQTGPVESFTLALQGMHADFKVELEDGLWLLAPGSATGKVEKTVVSLHKGDAAAQTLLALDAMDYSMVVERTGATLGWKTKAQTKGSVGPLLFDAITLNETVSRIDIEAMKLLQASLVDVYQKAAAQGEAHDPQEELASLSQAAPLLVAALPAYTMQMTATLEGKQGHLEYGAEIQKAPGAEQLQGAGLGPALMQGGALHAKLRLPTAWLPGMAKAFTQQEMSAEDLSGFVGMAEAQGFVRQAGEELISELRFEGGLLQINGKSINLASIIPR